MNASSIALVPPGTGGVRDYASSLVPGLNAPVFELGAHTQVDGLSGDLVWLHFSGYGFQKRGVPMWLVGAMRKLRPRFRHMGIVFHELFAPLGSPLQSAFWLQALQKRIARELLAFADFWVTSREESAKWLLGTQVDPVPHRVLPIFSNVGEPVSIDGARQDKLVVFGSASVRANVYRWEDGEIFRQARRAGLRIHDIGPAFAADDRMAQRLAEQGVVVHGRLPEAEVSAALLEARYGAIVYPVDYVAKSSIFAAYCAHGVCPILLAHGYDSTDGLKAGQHYIPGFEFSSGSADPALIGRAARTWYEPHRLSAHMAAFRALEAEVAG